MNKLPLSLLEYVKVDSGALFHTQSGNTSILTILHTFRVRQRGSVAAPAVFMVPREVLPMVPHPLKGTGDCGLQASWEKGHCGSLYSHASWFRKFETDLDIWREPPKVSLYFQFTLVINNLNCRICSSIDHNFWKSLKNSKVWNTSRNSLQISVSICVLHSVLMI